MLYSWEKLDSEKKLREQFDSILELWLRKVPHNNNQRTGDYVHGVIDGLYLLASSLIEADEMPILTKVRNDVHLEYGEMFNVGVQFK